MTEALFVTRRFISFVAFGNLFDFWYLGYKTSKRDGDNKWQAVVMWILLLTQKPCEKKGQSHNTVLSNSKLKLEDKAQPNPHAIRKERKLLTTRQSSKHVGTLGSSSYVNDDLISSSVLAGRLIRLHFNWHHCTTASST